MLRWWESYGTLRVGSGIGDVLAGDYGNGDRGSGGDSDRYAGAESAVVDVERAAELLGKGVRC